jgi:hypothetical protein
MPVHSIRAARAWRKRYVDQKVPSALTLETRRLRAAQAEMARLNLDLKLGKLMLREDVERIVREGTVLFVSRINALPGRTAGTIAGMNNKEEVRAYLLKEIREVLDATEAKFAEGLKHKSAG